MCECVGITADKLTAEEFVAILTEVRALQEIIAKFKILQVDMTEFACLKAIVIFKTSMF